ncbi:hypothetical protein LCI18_014016 [Fusarium solani-melongenae]|uniref:Uncharacterized protein n=1 Tax=Fusarium solani subsp. cucurbitae TaxID=2747967 RepID=A0ACD3ZPS0_FUSSC|nr:hypothetical protein LCI18_014016 [Fusarium solani-melongenae]
MGLARVNSLLVTVRRGTPHLGAICAACGFCILLPKLLLDLVDHADCLCALRKTIQSFMGSLHSDEHLPTSLLSTRYQPVPSKPSALPLQTTEVKVPKVLVAYANNNDDDIQMLHDNTPDPSRQVALHISFDQVLEAAFLKLCVPVPLQGVSNARHPLFLHLDPTRIASLTYGCPNEQPTPVNEQLGAEVSCLRFSLHQAPNMIVPQASLAPRNRDGRKKLGALKALAQQTRFDVYFAKGVLEDAAANSLCALVTSPTARPICKLADLIGLYAGKSGTVFTHLNPPSPEPSLPAYSQNPPALPLATPEKAQPSPASALGKRPRPAELKQDDVKDTCIKVFQEQSAQQRQRAQSELDDLKNEMMKDLKKAINDLREEMTEYIDQSINELHLSNAYSRSEVDDLIQKTERYSGDVMDVKIQDSILDAQADMEKHIREELENAEERVLEKMFSGSWVIDRGSVQVINSCQGRQTHVLNARATCEMERLLHLLDAEQLAMNYCGDQC